ncbi:MAG: transcriptional regulator [Methylococcales bacterium]|nr:transcriptional regulator [Methylococcales bacterium]
MYTIIETPIFQKYAAEFWNDDEREEFIVWLARNPEAGDVIQGAGGLRKVRWSKQGTGKSGGVRVIYFNRLNDGSIWLLIAYSKSKFDTLPTEFLNKLKAGIENYGH